ncbi:MAG TPA: hypothetical protein VFD89_10285 [Clostridia bacterium]|nr:hypothetical protein [Clostridia bacterium]
MKAIDCRKKASNIDENGDYAGDLLEEIRGGDNKIFRAPKPDCTTRNRTNNTGNRTRQGLGPEGRDAPYADFGQRSIMSKGTRISIPLK